MTHIRLATLAAAAFVAAGCSSKSPTQSTGTHSVVLRPGVVAQVGDALNFTLIRIDNDSRCATDVQCVSAGDATVVFAAVSPDPLGTTPALQFLHTNAEPRSIVVSGYRITLDSLLPRPVTTHVITQGEYVAYLSVVSLPD